jgi:hypothetical protein
MRAAPRADEVQVSRSVEASSPPVSLALDVSVDDRSTIDALPQRAWRDRGARLIDVRRVARSSSSPINAHHADGRG